jgi:hypothetical protein
MKENEIKIQFIIPTRHTISMARRKNDSKYYGDNLFPQGDPTGTTLDRFIGKPVLVIKNVPVGKDKKKTFFLPLNNPKLTQTINTIQALISYRNIVADLDSMFAEALNLPTVNNTHVLPLLVYMGKEMYKLDDGMPKMPTFKSLEEYKTYASNALNVSKLDAIKAFKTMLSKNGRAATQEDFDVKEDNRDLMAYTQKIDNTVKAITDIINGAETIEDIQHLLKPIQNVTYGQRGSVLGLKDVIKQSAVGNLEPNLKLDILKEVFNGKNKTNIIYNTQATDENGRSQNYVIQGLAKKSLETIQKIKIDLDSLTVDNYIEVIENAMIDAGMDTKERNEFFNNINSLTYKIANYNKNSTNPIYEKTKGWDEQASPIYQALSDFAANNSKITIGDQTYSLTRKAKTADKKSYVVSPNTPVGAKL